MRRSAGVGEAAPYGLAEARWACLRVQREVGGLAHAPPCGHSSYSWRARGSGLIREAPTVLATWCEEDLGRSTAWFGWFGTARSGALMGCYGSAYQAGGGSNWSGYLARSFRLSSATRLSTPTTSPRSVRSSAVLRPISVATAWWRSAEARLKASSRSALSASRCSVVRCTAHSCSAPAGLGRSSSGAGPAAAPPSAATPSPTQPCCGSTLSSSKGPAPPVSISTSLAAHRLGKHCRVGRAPLAGFGDAVIN
mmetsp:Transcript_11947/g.30574  ORF Transcript_11947/g.30574 Transcript_11947/m.30574 type:complete len:252 (+) Transcript_11947:321-1076(+)